MKKIFTSVLALFALQFSLSAQNTFQKVISVSGHPHFMVTNCHRNSDGTFLVCGNDAYTFNDGFFMKLDASQQVVWAKELLNTNSDLSIYNVGECIGGGYFVNGYCYDYNNGRDAVFLEKIDVNGNTTWNHLFDMAQGDMVYGNVAPKAMQLSNGDFLLTTATYSNMGFIRVDANGNVVFAQSCRGDSLSFKDPGLDGVLCPDGGILGCGKRENDPYFVKMDGTGNIQWSKIFHQDNFYDRIYRVISNADGSFYMCGMKYDLDTASGNSNNLINGFLMKMDATGNILWYKEYAHYSPSDEQIYFVDMKVLPNGDLFVAGADYETYQLIILTSDPNGNITSSRSVGNPIPNGFPYQFRVGLEVSSNNDVLISYATDDYADTTTSSYLFNSANLNFNWCDANYFPLTTNTPVYTPVVTTGAMMIQNIPVSTSQLIASTNATATVSDYCVTSGINSLTENSASIFPNPFSSSATLELNSGMIDGNTNLVLYDVLGNEVKEIKITSEKTEIEKADLSSGVYMYKIISANGIIGTGKIILKD